MAWEPKTVDFRSIKGMDPAANWLLGANAEEFLIEGENTLIPFLMSSADEGFDVLVSRAIDITNDIDGVILIEPKYEKDEASTRLAGVRLLLANRAWFVELAREQGDLDLLRTASKLIVLSNPSPIGGIQELVFPDPDPDYDPPEGGWPDDTVVMGVIDDGLAFANERFRGADGKSRVYSFWNMNILPDGELFKTGVDVALDDNRLGGHPDEDGVYRDTRLVDFRDLRHKTAAWRAAHGAHVMDLCAGYPPSANVTNRPIVAVQLPVSAVADTQARYLDWYLYLGIVHILRRARQLKPSGPPLPVVINASFGYITGPHDGSKLLEWFMDAVIDLGDGKTQIVLPAGNSHLSRCHAAIDFTKANPVEFDWFVLPNDLTTSYFEVWLPEGAPGDRLRLTVTRPDGAVHTVVDTPPASTVVTDTNGGVILLMQFLSTLAGRRLLRVQIQPTDRHHPDPRPIAPSGAWKLSFTPGGAGMDGVAHAWVQRDDTIHGYPQRGRQSYFVHPDYVRYSLDTFVVEEDDHPEQAECPVKRKSLVNAIATGRRTITAGGFRDCECRIAPYSAGGPTTPREPDGLRKPDALLPSETSKALFGVLAAGSRSGSVVALNGTSVAAPQLARLVAGWLGDTGVGNRAKVKSEAQNSGDCPDGFDADRGGWGALRRDDPRPVERRFCPGP